MGPLSNFNCYSVFQSSINTCLVVSWYSGCPTQSQRKNKQTNKKSFKGDFYILPQRTNGFQGPSLNVNSRASFCPSLQSKQTKNTAMYANWSYLDLKTTLSVLVHAWMNMRRYWRSVDYFSRCSRWMRVRRSEVNRRKAHRMPELWISLTFQLSKTSVVTTDAHAREWLSMCLS